MVSPKVFICPFRSYTRFQPYLLAHNNKSYYGQVNSLQLRSNVASKWASKHLWGIIYFAVGENRHLLTFMIKSCIQLGHTNQNLRLIKRKILRRTDQVVTETFQTLRGVMV